MLVRSLFESSQPGAEAEAEVWAESEVLGPPEPRLRQLQSQIAQSQMKIQMQHSQSSPRERMLRGHRLHDVLAALGRHPQEQSLH